MKTKREIQTSLKEYHKAKVLKAQKTADNNLSFARQNKEFNSNYLRINELNYLIAKKKYGKINCCAEMSELKKLQSSQKAILKELGLSDKSLLPQYTCKKCNDSGFVNDKPCSCYKRELTLSLLKENGLNYSMLGKLEDFNTTVAKSNKEHEQSLISVKKIIEKYCTNFPKVKSANIFINGQTGTGKTFSAECIASELIKKGFYVNLLSAFQTNEVFLEYHRTFDASKQDVLLPLLEPELLIIDDLGTEPVFNNVTREYLLLTVSERLLHGKKTIITSNLNLNEILTRYGDRFFSRFFNKSLSAVITIKGNDLRTIK